MPTLSDPRVFPLVESGATPSSARWHALVERSQSGETGRERAAAEADLHHGVVDALRHGRVDLLRAALESAPSAVCYRQLLRAIDAAWADPAVDGEATLVAHGFAIPVVVVAAGEREIEHPMVVPSLQGVREIIAEHRVFGESRSISISNALTGAGAVGLSNLEYWLDRRRLVDARDDAGLAPSSMRVAASQESAHLRFLAGALLAAPVAAVLDGSGIAVWGTPLAKTLSAALAFPGVQLLALPRTPQHPLAAWRDGLQAQREIALNLFASSAIRNLRANFGEPSAAVSAHRVESGGEVRLSLSSPFGGRDAEGFRCPLFPYDRVDDVASLIIDLMHACRVGDIRIVDGLQPDRSPITGGPLFFRADEIGTGASTLH